MGFQIVRIFTNRNFILLLAIVCGFVFPGPAGWTQMLMLPALALVMTLATLQVPNGYFFHPAKIIKPSFAGILMTYAVLGGVILAASALLIKEPAIRLGFVLIAAVPPAVAVIPFTVILKGDVSDALSGTMASYLAALVLTPFLLWLLVGLDFADPYKLIRVLLLLIVLPLVLSRLILFLQMKERIEPFRGLITDWGFFVVLYSMIGVNRDLIFGEPLTMIPVAGVVFTATFVLGYVIEKICGMVKMDQGKAVSLMLLGTLKNQGIAGGLAIALFEKEAALPSAMYSVFMFAYVLWLDLRSRKR